MGVHFASYSGVVKSVDALECSNLFKTFRYVSVQRAIILLESAYLNGELLQLETLHCDLIKIDIFSSKWLHFLKQIRRSDLVKS
jgi:hypothetical protein